MHCFLIRPEYRTVSFQSSHGALFWTRVFSYFAPATQAATTLPSLPPLRLALPECTPSIAPYPQSATCRRFLSTLSSRSHFLQMPHYSLRRAAPTLARLLLHNSLIFHSFPLRAQSCTRHQQLLQHDSHPSLRSPLMAIQISTPRIRAVPYHCTGYKALLLPASIM